MKISDFDCPSCGSAYEVAEAITLPGRPGEAHCVVCGALMASWQQPRLQAFRLMMAPEHKYPRAAGLASPALRN
jgi:uncharacterized Zn finger protein